VPEGSENVAEKIFFGNAKRELCDATTNALMRAIDPRAHEARLACDRCDFYICASRPNLDDKSGRKGRREAPGDKNRG
jgi:hypothetical protein